MSTRSLYEWCLRCEDVARRLDQLVADVHEDPEAFSAGKVRRAIGAAAEVAR